MPTLAIICAISENGVVGEAGSIPWYSPLDLAHFKSKTKEATVVMGRKTWESLPEKFRPLPGRENIVVTRVKGLAFPGAIAANSLAEAIDRATREKVFIIGGVIFWYEAMDLLSVTDAHITTVRKPYPINHGTTDTAPKLLRIPDAWPDFRLVGAKRIEEVMDGDPVTLDFCHWQRR